MKKSDNPKRSTSILNNGLHVHDWYLMPESFSEPLILDVLERFEIDANSTILDPFSGTGTTVLTSVLNGYNGIGIEINPFLHFASQIKLKRDTNTEQLEDVLRDFLNDLEILKSIQETDGLLLKLRANNNKDVIEPAMPRLYKWMSEPVVNKCLILKYLIKNQIPKDFQPYFLLAFASILRPASNMKLSPHAFGSNKQKTDSPVHELFCSKINKIVSDLKYVQQTHNDYGSGRIYNANSKNADTLTDALLPASLVVTSPPYLNNLDYTMQTRMELFFLDFTNNMGQLKSLRKQMVTSDAKAMYRDVNDSECVKNVQSINKIVASLKEVHKDKKWGWDYGYMTSQYFGGMFKVLKSLSPLIKSKAHLVFVVGESSHSGVLVPVPEILSELGERAGYTLVELNTIRKRRSSSHTFELRECEVIFQKR